MKKKLQYFLVFIAIIGISIVLYRDYHAKTEFCDDKINGRIDSIKTNIKGYYSIKVNNNWHYLGPLAYCSNNEFVTNLFIGDSIIKEKNCNKIYLVRDGSIHDISIEEYLPCDCNKK